MRPQPHQAPEVALSSRPFGRGIEASGQRGKDAELHMARLITELLRSSKYVKNFVLDTSPVQETKILFRGAMHLAESVPQINIPLQT